MPVLRGILPPAYFAHYSLLVASLHMLSSHCVSTSDVDAAEVYLDTFYRSSVLLYGRYICTELLTLLYKDTKLFLPISRHVV